MEYTCHFGHGRKGGAERDLKFQKLKMSVLQVIEEEPNTHTRQANFHQATQKQWHLVGDPNTWPLPGALIYHT